MLHNAVVVQSATITMYLRQAWRDPRLSFRNISGLRAINLVYFLDDIWVPDIFFRYARSSFIHYVTVDNKMLTITSTGDIYHVMK